MSSGWVWPRGRRTKAIERTRSARRYAFGIAQPNELASRQLQLLVRRRNRPRRALYGSPNTDSSDEKWHSKDEHNESRGGEVGNAIRRVESEWHDDTNEPESRNGLLDPVEASALERQQSRRKDRKTPDPESQRRAKHSSRQESHYEDQKRSDPERDLSNH